MRIAIVGAGALGLYYGAMLQRAGHDLRYLLRRDYQAIMENGLRVLSVNGDFHLDSVKGFKTASEMGEADLVLVGLKTFANHMFGELIAPLVGEKTTILTLQNGLGNEDFLADLFGAERVLGGVAFLCANRGEPGEVHHLGEGRIIIGEYARCETGSIEDLSKMFQLAGIPCRTVADLKKARWEKLVWNIPFNGICALMLKTVDVLLSHGGTRQLIVDIMHEVIQAGNAQDINEKIKAGFADSLVTFTEGLGPYKPSMLIDRLEHRQLELDAIFKVPLAAAKKKGVHMSKVEELYALLDLSEAESKV
jgi:2-dehydropantoate 2-reductase